jgi:hypothetical protein
MKTSTVARRFRPWRGIAVVAAIALFSLAGSGVWAYWSAGSGAGGNGVAAATTVGGGATPTVVSAGTTVNLNWAPSTLANGSAVTGYLVRRYNASTLVAQTILSSCSGTITGTSCTESSVPAGSWRYSVTPVVGTNWTGAESPLSPVVYTDSTLPANGLSLSNVSGGAGMSGTTIYYNSSSAGSLTITNAVTDTGSGPASSATSALAGTTTGWTHSASTVSTPTGGPYVSNTFSWAAGTTSSPTDTVTGSDLANNTATTTVSFVNDSTAPTGTISYTNSYQAGRSVAVTFTGADSGSGLASAQLQRDSANFVNGACQTFTAFSNLGAVNPVSPYTDSTVTNAKCYNYRYVLTDLVGNTLTATSTSTAWVDYAGAVRYETTGILSQWRFGDSTILTGTKALDSVGSNSGVYSAGVTQGTVGELPNDSNTAATFNGSAGDMQVATTTGLPTGAASRSVEMWFKTSATTQQALFSYGSLANNEEFGLWLNSGGASMTAWGWSAGADKTFTLSAAVNDGKWHQVVETYNGTSITIYIDGVALTSQAATRNTVIDTTGFGIGEIIPTGDPNSGFNFNGSIDEVSLYTTALTQTDVTNHYLLGANSSTDTTGPTGGSVTASGLAGTGSIYSTSTTINLTLTKGIDTSGVAATGALLFRASAPLTSASNANGVCGTFSAFSLVATDPTTPYADTVADQECYAYEYAVPDIYGNYSTFAGSILKVDATPPPTPVLTFSAMTNTYFDGTTLYYRASQTTGSFTITATSTDPTSGIPTYTFPAAFGTHWTVNTVSTIARKYAWTATGSTGAGVESVTVTNNAGQTSAAASFTLAQDSTAPAGATLSYATGTQGTTPISVTFAQGIDAGSGIDTAVLEVGTSSPNIFTGVCAAITTYAAVAPVATTSPYTYTATANKCYSFEYVVTDNVGNIETVAGPGVLKVT